MFLTIDFERLTTSLCYKIETKECLDISFGTQKEIVSFLCEQRPLNVASSLVTMENRKHPRFNFPSRF